jgi:hypothetical protein
MCEGAVQHHHYTSNTCVRQADGTSVHRTTSTTEFLAPREAHMGVREALSKSTLGRAEVRPLIFIQYLLEPRAASPYFGPGMSPAFGKCVLSKTRTTSGPKVLPPPFARRWSRSARQHCCALCLYLASPARCASRFVVVAPRCTSQPVDKESFLCPLSAQRGPDVEERQGTYPNAFGG